MHNRSLPERRCTVAKQNPSIVNENRRGEKVVGKQKTTSCRPIKWSCRNHLIVVIILLAVLELLVQPYQQIGFFCNDPKISFKFTGDTISAGVIISFSVAVPLLVIWIAEYIYYSADSYENASYYDTRSKLIWRWYGHYAAGILTLTLLCEAMKVMIGEPRPHFLDTCKPREAANCTNEYVISYTCTNTEVSTWSLNDSNKSFPSGHAALSVYTSIFLVWYLQNRMPNRTLFLKPWLQCLVSMWAVTCSITRVGDNRHHWWDVLIGDVLGLLFGLFVVILSCRHFCLERTAANAADAATHALNEPLENGQIGGYDMQRKHNVKKLLNPTAVDISEVREMKDIGRTWSK
ncbi:PREDICTED: phospholipid phosphatase 1-like isoform X2 [Trachymyrmex cornetzi]|uniref:phospholipid phosphatase 1-like isoform X2 n=1 Tax=Trachymyrmex cornetzi TaxID=471704 RepID=UPI00084F7245|nr:PREDICTED: phospholipid phosphatase 1-like isoform X2 [Trachymyrmex cornetzi]